ncbi:lysophospholipid acyltransferase family protein [bacterium]|nr:lysophospholipid acyltransferase family protein [bacterium]
MLKYFLCQLIHFVAFWVPIRFAYWLGERTADVHCLLGGKSRRIIEDNLRQVLGEEIDQKEIERKARKALQNFGKYVVDFSRFRQISKKNLEKFITVEGMENLKEAFFSGRGVIGLTAHLGNWELGGATLALLGYPVNAVALPHAQAPVNRLFVKQRTKKGVKVIPFGAAAKKCYQALRRGEIVALLGDWDISSQGIEVPFFRKLTTIAKGPATFALKTGCYILPGFTIRQRDNRFKLFFEKPFVAERTGDKETDLKTVSQKVAKVLEKYISGYPDQWFLFHRMWPEENK